MNRKQLRPAADQSGSGLGSGICSAALSGSKSIAAAHPGQVVDLQAYRLRRRFGVSDAVARLLSDHAFGQRTDVGLRGQA